MGVSIVWVDHVEGSPHLLFLLQSTARCKRLLAATVIPSDHALGVRKADGCFGSAAVTSTDAGRHLVDFLTRVCCGPGGQQSIGCHSLK
eukprot:4589635-Amphidinium_carterae.1